MNILDKVKINNYQIAMFLFAILVFVGHVTTYFYSNETLLILPVWFILITSGLIVQFILLNQERKNFKQVFFSWIFLFISGLLLSLAIQFDSIEANIQANAFWFIIISLGMLMSSIIYNNITYIFLSIDYLVCFIIFQFFLEGNTNILAGIIFVILIFMDILLEYSFLRRKISFFEPILPEKPTKFKQLLQFEKKLTNE